METLTLMQCVPCRGDEPRATPTDIAAWQPQITGWELVEEDGVNKLRRTFRFKNFAEALAFVDEVGARAEERGHHPVIEFTWGRATVTWWTHAIKGLHRNDFIMAAVTDEVLKKPEA